jgi:hypothetical protein
MQHKLEPLEALRVLKLTGFFSPRTGGANPKHSSEPLLLSTARDIAGKIFGWKLPKLTAVVVVFEGSQVQLRTTRNFAFLRSKEVDSAGDEKFVAIPIEPHMIKHHVPCADILEDERFVFT